MASCPSGPIEDRVSPVLQILLDNKEESVLGYLAKGGMQLRSGRVLSEPSSKRVKWGGKSMRGKSMRGKSMRGKSMRGKKNGGGKREIVLDGLASILAACTIASGLVSIMCSFGPVISSYITGYVTMNLEPKCADTFKINGYDTGFGFMRSLTNALKLITSSDSCGAIDEQHDIAAMRIDILLLQLVNMSAFTVSLSFPQVKKYWYFVLNACINVTIKSVGAVGSSLGAVGSYVKSWLSDSKEKLIDIKKDFNKQFTTEVIEEIRKELVTVTDPKVKNALKEASEFLEKNSANISPEILVEVRQQTKARSMSPAPIAQAPITLAPITLAPITLAQAYRQPTPRAESLVPGSKSATPTGEEFSLEQGGRKTQKRKAFKRSKSIKRRKSIKRSNKNRRSK